MWRGGSVWHAHHAKKGWVESANLVANMQWGYGRWWAAHLPSVVCCLGGCVVDVVAAVGCCVVGSVIRFLP